MGQQAVKKRSDTIDMMKGIAMIMTIFCHAIQRAMPDGPFSQTAVWQFVHWWHMPLFFLVSGYLAAKSKQLGTAEFIKKKTVRLLYVWFIWRWMEWIFMRFEFSGVRPFNNIPESFTGCLLSFVKSPFRPLWFTIDLYLIFLLLCLIHVIAKNNKYLYGFLIALCIIASGVLYFVFRRYGARQHWQFFYLYYDFQYIALFFFGFIFSKALTATKKPKKCIAVTLMISFAVMVFALLFIKTDHLSFVVDWGRSVFITTLIGLGMKLLDKGAAMKFFALIKRGLCFVGLNSMEFYTMQFISLNCGWFIPNVTLRYWANFVFCMAICTFFTILIKRKIPVLDKILWGNIK